MEKKEEKIKGEAFPRDTVMVKVLLIEDDENIAFGIQAGLQGKGYQVRWAENAAQGIELFEQGWDVVLLDLNLPDGNGYEVCRQLKERLDTPILFLTVRDDERDIVTGLDMGADDYIVKPFQLSVLESRIRAVLRRTKKENGEYLTCGDIILDREKTKAYAGGKEIILTAGEYRLLLVLMENKNYTLTRTRLLEKLWDQDGAFVNDNTLTVTMKRLREKLGYPPYIQTLRGIGYRMEEKQ